MQISIQAMETGVHIARMADDLHDRKAEFDHREWDMKLQLFSANDHKTKITQLLEERVREIQKASLEKRLLREELEHKRTKKGKLHKDAQFAYSLWEASIHDLKEARKSVNAERIMAIKR